MQVQKLFFLKVILVCRMHKLIMFYIHRQLENFSHREYGAPAGTTHELISWIHNILYFYEVGNHTHSELQNVQ